MTDDRETEDYKVGYGKPPKSGQFKKGASGNPSGRPKKAPDFGSELLRVLNSPLIINDNGKRKVITKYQGLAMQLVNKAISGNLPATRFLVPHYQQAAENAAEQQRRPPYNPDLPADLLSEEELMTFIRDDVEKSLRPELEKSIRAKLEKSIRAELKKSNGDGANGR
jgi:hypothetical protein